MSQRFFVDDPIGDAKTIRITGQEAQHLGRVMRAKRGDDVVVFDGSGSEFVAQVDAVGRNEVDVIVTQKLDVDRELSRSVTLAVAMPKGDRQKWLVEKAVELGVAAIVPLKTQRGVAQPKSSAIKRLERAVVEASKQCGRNRLLAIHDPATLEEIIEDAGGEDGNRWVAHPGGEPMQDVRDDSPCWIAIGPEGGFTDQETSLAVEAGWKTVGLGPRILRIETAALTLASLLANR